jgi:CRP-like cAMP-binding protein
VGQSHPHPLSIRNCLLTALPADALARVLPRLTPVDLPLRATLCAAEAPIEQVHFPESGMVSLVAELEEGTRQEVGIVGREGMVGTPLVFGVESAFTDMMVQLPGSALRIGAAAFRRELDESPPFRALMLRYCEAANSQIAQTAACNGRHGLEQRLARWLLMAHDRFEDDALPLTQDFLAIMLGVHRPSITITAGILQRSGLIRYANGLITVLDRRSLEAASCECYAIVQRRFTNLLGTNSNGL